MRLLPLLLLLTLPLTAQEDYRAQYQVIERLLNRENYAAAQAQAETLIDNAAAAQLPPVEARGRLLLGRALLEDPTRNAQQRLEGIRELQRAAEGFRRIRDLGMAGRVDSVLNVLSGGGPMPRISGVVEEEEEEIDEEDLQQLLQFQNRAIAELTDSQARQVLKLERQQRRLEMLSVEAMNDSLMLLQQDRLIEVRDAQLETNRQRRNFLILLTLTVLGVLGFLYYRYQAGQKFQARLQQKNELIEEERRRSDRLLLNILPQEVAEELKDTGKATARQFDEVSVLFADFKGFSSLAKDLSPAILVDRLDEAFRAFDEIVAEHGLEKIKTVGDAYMCAAGLPTPSTDHAERCVAAALAMQAYLDRNPHFDARIGIHSGPVVAGVVGKDKFAYDIWGDTVNQAARLEAASEVGKISISSRTCELIGDHFVCERRGTFEAKNIGQMDRYVVTAAAPAG